MGRTLLGFVVTLSTCVSLSAQWLHYPTAGVPRTRDGKPNLTAPAPKTPDGKPDFTGIWLTADSFCPVNKEHPEILVCGLELPMGTRGINFGFGIKEGLPYQSWLAALVKERTGNQAKDDPHVKCMPDTFLRAYSLPHL